MKLIIPPKCQIGALNYKIVFSDYLLGKLENRATSNVAEQIIRLRKRATVGNKEISHEQLLSDLCHEIEHIINDTAGLSEEEHEIVIRGSLMTQALLSLGIEPVFSQIPEE